jgi:hypothetical protein
MGTGADYLGSDSIGMSDGGSFGKYVVSSATALGFDAGAGLACASCVDAIASRTGRPAVAEPSLDAGRRSTSPPPHAINVNAATRSAHAEEALVVIAGRALLLCEAREVWAESLGMKLIARGPSGRNTTG